MFNGLQSHFSWVQGRNCHFLELGDSLPGGGFQPARNLMWVSALSIVLCSHWMWLKALSCSCWWGVTFVILCVWSIVLWVTPWRFWAQAASSLAGRGLHLQEKQSFLQISCPKPLSPWGQAWLLLEQGNQPLFICAPCASGQKPFGVPGGLCSARLCSARGWTSRLAVLVHRALVPWGWQFHSHSLVFTRFALFPVSGSCSCSAWPRISQLPLSTCIAQSWVFVDANDLLQRVLWKVKRYQVVYFFILARKTASELFITCCKIFIVLEMLVNVCCRQQYKHCLKPCAAF